MEITKHAEDGFAGIVTCEQDEFEDLKNRSITAVKHDMEPWHYWENMRVFQAQDEGGYILLSSQNRTYLVLVREPKKSLIEEIAPVLENIRRQWIELQILIEKSKK